MTEACLSCRLENRASSTSCLVFPSLLISIYKPVFQTTHIHMDIVPRMIYEALASLTNWISIRLKSIDYWNPRLYHSWYIFNYIELISTFSKEHLTIFTKGLILKIWNKLVFLALFSKSFPDTSTNRFTNQYLGHINFDLQNLLNHRRQSFFCECCCSSEEIVDMACVEDKLEMDVDLTGLNDSNNAAALQRSRSSLVQNRHNPLPSCRTKTTRTKTSSRKSDGSVNDDGKIRKNTSRQVSECNLFHSCFEDDCMCNGNPVRGYSCVPNNEHAIFWRAKFCLRCTVRY